MPQVVDKQELLALFKQHLEIEIERSKARARDAAEAATHTENRAEGDKDMRSTEASYLARGHSERLFSLEQALSRLNVLSPRQFNAGDGIQSTALVCLAHETGSAWYFLIPCAGGQRVTLNGCEVQALTTQSPLGSALLGLSQGDDVEVVTPQGPRNYSIESVS